jgi:predicted metal-binding protein
MSQCKRPCVVAFSHGEKFTYLFGDLDPTRDAAAILDTFELYAARPDGFMERFERPNVMRDGILGRVPPLAPATRQVEPRPRRSVSIPIDGDGALASLASDIVAESRT